MAKVRQREGIYDPESYCSCTRESAQLGERREMGYRCNVSNTEAWTSIDTLQPPPPPSPLHFFPKHQNLLIPFSPFQPLFPLFLPTRLSYSPKSTLIKPESAPCIFFSSFFGITLQSFPLFFFALRTQQVSGFSSKLGLLLHCDRPVRKPTRTDVGEPWWRGYIIMPRTTVHHSCSHFPPSSPSTSL